MPYMKGGKRDYRREYDLYHASEREKNKRVARNAARRMFEKAGLVHKGDDRDIDHITPLSRGGGHGRSNLRVVSSRSNRSFKRTSSSAVA